VQLSAIPIDPSYPGRMPVTVRHPIFARVYERIAAAEEAKGAAQYREALLDGLSGRVIEVGCGHGLNFSHYPRTVTEVVAVEPEAYLRAKAEHAAGRAPVHVTVVDGTVDDLPGNEASFDAAVTSLVLCTVPDVPAALAEIRRVMRPGGELRFYEHVVAQGRGWAAAQRAVDVMWPFFAGGCHADRDTLSAIKEAGFVVETVRSFTFRSSWLTAPTWPKVLGRARRP
jgi:ubiquinone/menaquinone biosynthesis C-methylase UbiE